MRNLGPQAESLNVKKFKGKKVFKKPQESSKNTSSGQKETHSCRWCKKPGHLKKDCYAWKRKQENEGKAVNSAEGTQEDDEAHEVLNVMEGGVLSSWIMDSGCSFHMSHNLGWFEDIEEATGSVILGNNQVCSVRLKGDDGVVVVLSGVRYIPDVKRNLISLGFLERKRCSFASADGKMQVCKSGKTLMKAHRKGSLYYLIALVCSRKAGEAHTVTPSSLLQWHNRLGHPAAGSIKDLVKKGVL